MLKKNPHIIISLIQKYIAINALKRYHYMSYIIIDTLLINSSSSILCISIISMHYYIIIILY